MSPTTSDAGQLYTHLPYMESPKRIASVGELYIGDVIKFTYGTEIKHAFVLDPNFLQKMHGLSLTMIPRSVLVSSVIGNMDQTDDPLLLYQNFVSTSDIADYDGYRTYLVKKISNIVRYAYILDKVEQGDTDLDEEQKARGRKA